MDGRDFGPPRSVHVPPPLLGGLAMEQHRLGAAAAAGRIPPSPGHLGASHPPPLHSGKFLPSAINLHSHHSDAFPASSSLFLSGYPGPSHLTSDPAYRGANPSSLQMAQLWASHTHEGYPSLPSSLYQSPYLSLGHLDPPSLSQHPLYDSHKEGFYLPSSLNTLHPPPPPLPTVPSSSTPPQRTSRDSREKPYRGDRERDRDRSRDELRPHSVVDLTQDGRGEEGRRARSSDREQDREKELLRDGWTLHSHPNHHKSSGETRSRPSPPRPHGSSSRLHGTETDNSNNSERQRRNDLVATSAGALHVSCGHPPPPAASRESMREQRVSAPTYVPSVEVYDERPGPIQIASQARDNKHGDKHRDREQERDKEREGYRFSEHSRLAQFSDASNQREEGSVICSNGKRGQDPSGQSRFSPDARDIPKHSSRLALERATVDSKWNTISPLANYATSHMAALAAQHGHALSSPHSQPPAPSQMSHSPHTSHRTGVNSSHSHSPQTHSEESGQRRYLDPAVLYRPGTALVGGSNSGERGGDSTEISAMQSLIKYSGNFGAEGGGSSRLAAENRGPFGGLASIGMEEREREREREKERERDRLSVGSASSTSLRVPPQLKREQERPDSARSFGREGEGEVRHPPVGIAVAVARQRDSSSSKHNSGTTDSQRALLPTVIKDEERGEERSRHHDNRLMGGRLERDQEKVLRESKELAEFTQMHPAPLSSGLTPNMMTPTLMNPNLMVTGGAALSGAGRWPPDPSTLTSHPWMPRPGAPPVWLSSSPYSLGPSSLHQTMPPGYPPSLAGSMPPPYQFARDPQSGQLIVIPTEHLPHYGGDVLDRGAPVWSGVYGTSSSLQHAAQLQLLSQQQMLRQQELLMIQQHTAQVLEMQRNAQLVERLKASEHRPDVEDKPDKRNTDPKPQPSSATPSPTLHPRKPHSSSRSPTPSTSSLTPLPPMPSPVTSLKSEEVVGQRELSHPPMLLPHLASPRSASPPPSSPRRPKRESAEDGEVGKRGEVQKRPPASYQGIYTDLPPGYPYQSITAPFGSPFPPYHVPPPTGSNSPHRSHSPSKPSLLPPPHLHSRLLDANTKPPKLEPSKTASFLKQEPGSERPHPGVAAEPLGPLRRTCGPVLTNQIKDRKDPKPQPICLTTSTPPPLKSDRLVQSRDEEKIKREASSFSCHVAYPPRLALTEAEPKSELTKDLRTQYPLCITADAEREESAHKSQDQTSVCEPEQQDTPLNLHASVDKEKAVEIPPISNSPLPLIGIQEDPMAGMLALLAASEMAEARPCTPPAPTLTPVMDNSPMSAECSMAGPLEMVALEGMALLSQMAQQEMENISQEQDVTMEGLECLLEASRQILLEAIEKQSHIELPRELDPNKKYSWRQRKEEPLFSKMSVDVLDAVEVEYRVRLAELQKTYKEKQRELSKLQRRTDKHERLQEDDRRSLARRGRGRPRKRKLMATPPKLDSRPGKVGRTVQYSEDSEAGEGQRKRFRISKEDEETEANNVKLKKKKKKKSWKDQDNSSLEVLKAKRSNLNEQEQLASDLNRALSLSQLGSLASSHKLTSSTKADKSKGKSSENRVKERSIHASAKGTKHKISGKASSSEMVQKVKSQKKRPMFSPVRSELSSCSNNSDSEEHISARGGWPPLSNSRSCDNLSRKRRSTTSPTSLLSSKKTQKKKHKHLSLLLEEAGLSSSDDSFDQETSEADEEGSDSDDGACEESGLGLLARFAASALPVSSPALGLHDAKQRNRQSILGSSECEWSDSGSDLRTRKFPSLLYGKRSAPELPLLPPATHRIDQTSPTKRDESLSVKRKPLSKPRPSPRSPRRFSFDLACGFGGFSEDEGWNRRRSERIFLNDATASANQMSMASSVSTNQGTSSVSSAAPSLSLKPSSRLKPALNREGKDAVKKKKLKDSPLPLSPSTLSSPITDGPVSLSLSPVRKSQTKTKTKAREVREPSRGAVSRLMESMAADEDFEPNQDSSFSEDEMPPSCDSSVIETSPPPAPVQCVLDKDSLVDGLRVLIPMDDQLLYAGHVNTVHSPDIYSVVVEGERGNRPHIYCLEQLLQEAIIDVKPPSVRYLPEGTRIAAYWSQQYRCLYPGTVVNGNSDMDENDNLITVEFDDGDTGRIPLSHIRLLPPDYKIHCAEPSPALLVASCSRRRVRKCSKEGKEAGPKPDDSTPKIKGKPGRKPKPKPETTLIQDGREKTDGSPSILSDRPPAKLTQDRTPSVLKASQEKPRPASRPSMELNSKTKSKSSSSTPTSSPTLSSPVPRKDSLTQNSKSGRSLPSSLYPSTYGKVLTVDLYTEPNLSSYNSQRRDKDHGISPTSNRPLCKSNLSKPSVATTHKPSSASKPKSSTVHHNRPSLSSLASTINRLASSKPSSLAKLTSSSSLSSVPRPKMKMPSDQLTSRTSSLPRPKSSSTQNEIRRKPLSAEPLVKLDHEGVTSPKTKKTKLMLLEGRGGGVRRDHTPIATTNQKPPKAKARENGPIEKDRLFKSTILAKEKTARVSKAHEVDKKEVKREELKHESQSSSSSDSDEDGDKEKVKKKRKKCTSSCSGSSSSCSGSSSCSSSSSSSSSSTDESSCSSDEERTPTPPPPGPVSPPPPTQDKPKEEVKEEPKEEVKKEKEDKVEREEFSPSESPSTSPTTTAPAPAKPNKASTGKGSGQRGRPPKQKPSGGEGKVGRPKRREGVHLPTTKELAKRQRLPSVENRPKISAFLPARQLWKWFGKPTQRRGMKGKAKKLFYKAIVRGREMIRIGDCAVFLSAGRPNLPFIGRIQSMWESWGSNMVVRVNWFYHPEETNPGKKLIDKKNWDQMCGQSIPATLHSNIQRKDFVERALYQSSHSDENDVQTVSHKCLVVSVEEYEQMTHTRRYADSEDLYYLAGTYEPTTGMIFNTDGVPVIC